jgi:DnaK suppressor protein
MLTDEDKDKLKKIIERRLESTKEEMVELEELTKPIPPENAIGRISRMDAINNRSISEAALNQTKEKMVNLQLALSNIDHSAFGKCVRCGGDIPLGRLMIMPESTRCVKCPE